MPNYFVIMLKFEFQINPVLYVYRDAGHDILQHISVILLQAIWQDFRQFNTYSEKENFPIVCTPKPSENVLAGITHTQLNRF